MKIKCSIQKYLSIENVVLFFIFLFLISYTAIRMYNIPLTHDECVSYQQYSVHSTFQIITYTKVSTIPNNHILNTLFIKAINTLSFGSATWLLRFHIWLSYIMFFIFSVLIVKEMNIRWLVVPAVVLLNFNPYMLEFFSLARGYGLAISCMLGSMYYFVKYIRKPSLMFGYLTFTFAALSVWSNFTLLNFYISLFGAFVLFVAFKQLSETEVSRKKIVSQLKPAFIVSIVLFLLIINPLIRIQNDLFGGSRGFFLNTVDTLIYWSYRPEDRWVKLFTAVVKYLSIVYVVVFGVRLIASVKKAENTDGFWLMLITVLAAFSTVVQHFLFNTPYLSGRTALFYYPLFMVNTVFFAKELHLFVVSRYVALPVYASAAIFNCWLFVGLMNISYTMDWKYDADNLKLIEYLENRAKTTDKKIELTISWLYEPSLMFYKEKFHLHWLEVHNFSEGEKLNDFVLFQPYESEKMGNKMNDYPTVVPFFTSSSALYIKH